MYLFESWKFNVPVDSEPNMYPVCRKMHKKSPCGLLKYLDSETYKHHMEVALKILEILEALEYVNILHYEYE